MSKQNSLLFDIQLFAEGGGGEGGAGGEGAEGVQAADAGQQRAGEKGNPLANVIYGKQEREAETAADAGQLQEGQSQEKVGDRAAQFKAMIRGDYKDLYDAEVQRIVRARLSAAEEKAGKYEATEIMRQMLGKRYGVDPNDAQALTAAIEADNSFYEEEAAALGMSIEQFREMQRYKRENEALHAKIQESADEAKAQEIYAEWMSQEEEMKKTYPGFDLRTELEDPLFEKLISEQVPIRTAYEVVHHDEIITAAMTATANQIEQKLTNKIAAGAGRPREGAIGGQSAAVYKNDVSKFTKADRAEILRRAQRGERIEL